MFKKIGFLSLMILSNLSSLSASEKIYVDRSELKTTNNTFRIHTGHNIWIETSTIHRDTTGLYTFENDITRSMNNKLYEDEYKRTWKCPYCYTYWPIGTACKNPDCPSRYKMF